MSEQHWRYSPIQWMKELQVNFGWDLIRHGKAKYHVKLVGIIESTEWMRNFTTIGSMPHKLHDIFIMGIEIEMHRCVG